MFAYSDPNLLLIFLVVLVLCGIFYGVYKHAEARRPKVYCEKCGGEMTPDAEKYRYTIEWTCNECGATCEQLRIEL